MNLLALIGKLFETARTHDVTGALHADAPALKEVLSTIATKLENVPTASGVSLAAEGKMGDMDERLKGLEAHINEAVSNRLSAFGDRIGDVESGLSGFAKSVQAAQDSVAAVAAMQKIVDAANKTVGEIGDRVTTIEKFDLNLGAATEEIAAIREQLKSMLGADSALDGRIDGAIGRLDALEKNLGNVRWDGAQWVVVVPPSGIVVPPLGAAAPAPGAPVVTQAATDPGLTKAGDGTET